ncbi:MAG: amidohydrolase [Acidobacteria bacterium]|nr:MAG: amidohydrolase [Acidobacteriota bacterium]
MNRRSFLNATAAVSIAAALPSRSTLADGAQLATQKPGNERSPETILLKDYRPKSLHRVPVTEVAKAKFPIIDMHSHPYAETPAQVDEWVRNMDEVGVQKTIILTMTTGTEFDAIYRKYAKYPDRFELWCGLDLTGYDQPGFGAATIKELERCHQTGARGVGELHDKGKGLSSGGSKTVGMHPDDGRVTPLFEKCAELRMPVSLHVADPIWMYQPMDETNDGLMNAYEWRLDNQPDIVKLPALIDILEHTVRKHPRTTFVACHFANLDYDLARLGGLFERNPNLYADISARYAETAPIPRFTAQFYAKHADRLVYGTDMGFDKPMYRITFRILETLDEHFYEIEQFGYHWSLSGFGLPDSVLKRVYHDNAAKLLARRT